MSDLTVQAGAPSANVSNSNDITSLRLEPMRLEPMDDTSDRLEPMGIQSGSAAIANITVASTSVLSAPSFVAGPAGGAAHGVADAGLDLAAALSGGVIANFVSGQVSSIGIVTASFDTGAYDLLAATGSHVLATMACGHTAGSLSLLASGTGGHLC